jgi:hypothetical protein
MTESIGLFLKVNWYEIAVVWHTMTGIDSQTLSLAAQQAQWPRFKSDIEPVAALSQQGRFDR